MQFALIIPFHNQFDITIKCIESFLRTSREPVELYLIDNGSDLSDPGYSKLTKLLDFLGSFHKITLQRFEKNKGVFPTFKETYKRISGRGIEWFFFIHNDTMMCCPYWDTKLQIVIKKLENPGVCGFFGALQLGTYDIYHMPYNLMQLQRYDCWTNRLMLRYGAREIPGMYSEVIVLDGYSLIVNRKVLKLIAEDKKLDNFPVHHMYDAVICADSHFAGYKNYVLNIECDHLGGKTSCHNDGEYAKQFNETDFEIHRRAHEVFYERYRNRLPIAVGEIARIMTCQ